MIKMSFYYSRKSGIFPRVNLWFLSKIANIFPVYFSVRETLVLLFHDVVFSKEGFSDQKNVILL